MSRMCRWSAGAAAGQVAVLISRLADLALWEGEELVGPMLKPLCQFFLATATRSMSVLAESVPPPIKPRCPAGTLGLEAVRPPTVWQRVGRGGRAWSVRDPALPPRFAAREVQVVRKEAWAILHIKVETVQALQTALTQEAGVEAVVEHLVRDPMLFPI